jgi:hypothetical protein
MPQALDKIIGEWREAETKARAAEKSVADARLLFFQRQGNPPHQARVDEAKLLRKLANEKQKMAIEAMTPRRQHMPKNLGHDDAMRRRLTSSR